MKSSSQVPWADRAAAAVAARKARQNKAAVAARNALRNKAVAAAREALRREAKAVAARKALRTANMEKDRPIIPSWPEIAKKYRKTNHLTRKKARADWTDEDLAWLFLGRFIKPQKNVKVLAAMNYLRTVYIKMDLKISANRKEKKGETHGNYQANHDLGGRE